MLTDVQLRRLTPREKPYKLSDTGGLFILVQTGGSQLWRNEILFWREGKTALPWCLSRSDPDSRT